MKLSRSLSFRLALVYAAMFAVSLVLLFGIYYLVSVPGPLRAVQSSLQAESQALVDQFGDAATADLVKALKARVRAPNERSAYHVLLDPKGQVMTQNLPSWPAFSGQPWLRIETDTYHNGEEVDHLALALDRRLGDGARLILGRDVVDIDQRRETLFGAARWMAVSGGLFAVLVGTLMSLAIGKRIDSINRTALQVMGGDLHERVLVRGSGDDFDRLAETLNLMLARIQGLLESMRRVSDTVAHELRTPLTRLHAELSELRTAVDPEHKSIVDAAAGEAQKVIALFDAAMRIGRIESTKEHVDTTELDLSSLLRDVIELFGPSAEEKSIALEASIADGLHVVANRDLLFQAIGNVLDNAIKYSPRGGLVRLRAQSSTEGVRIVIADAGPGIPPEQRDNVLQRFVRLPQTAGVPGLGLGLSFVKAVADAHQASLNLEDAAPGLRVIWLFGNQRWRPGASLHAQ